MLGPDELDACAALAEELAAFAISTQAGRRVGPDERSTKTAPGDWVTVVDLEIERHTRERLAERFPEHVVCGEELGTTGHPASGAPVWYLDPIDGTTNFVHALPWSSFSLAVADGAGLAAAVVADPHRGAIFSARRSAGARRDGVAMSCSDRSGLEGGLVLTELLGVYPWPGLSRLLEELGRRFCVTRVPGSTALSLASFADGSADAVVLGGFHPIDIAAGLLLAAEAGAVLWAPRRADPVVIDWIRRRSPLTPPAGALPAQLDQDLLVAVSPGAAPELAEVLAGLQAP